LEKLAKPGRKGLAKTGVPWEAEGKGKGVQAANMIPNHDQGRENSMWKGKKTGGGQNRGGGIFVNPVVRDRKGQISNGGPGVKRKKTECRFNVQ